VEDKRDPDLLNILLGLRDLLRVFLGRWAKILLQSLEYNYVIDLEEGKLPLNLFIYNLSCKELKILQEYLDSLLEKGWIWLSKLLVSILILFILKQDGTMRLYIDYCGLNRVIIKNRYPLLLVSKMLDWLFRVKIFIKLDLWDVYHKLYIKEGDEWKAAFKT
jgi:hypothetical protein